MPANKRFELTAAWPLRRLLFSVGCPPLQAPFRRGGFPPASSLAAQSRVKRTKLKPNNSTTLLTAIMKIY